MTITRQNLYKKRKEQFPAIDENHLLVHYHLLSKLFKPHILPFFSSFCSKKKKVNKCKASGDLMWPIK